ncbi:DUF3168 domain-containing protein [Oceanomicrobium pacificus]|uniref:DUF3168 domain-containing protein n=1 Tax=Oceanomicrobium pacificus TaxID=2692916 RepID=A0A6B0TP32_9RHOB|nr:DUF3168 domain-containing protein [Oceanomicrobium pacificus]MXU66317.1 DUF3168 domain-containing protein [Oceanomicrobium pacificus]
MLDAGGAGAMTLAHFHAVQARVFALLTGDPELMGLTGGHVRDGAAAGAPLPDVQVLIGPERVRPFASATSDGATHEFTVEVIGARDGFDLPKRVAARVGDLLLAPAGIGDPDGAHLVRMQFLRAEARRLTGPARRQIRLTFRAVVESDEN